METLTTVALSVVGLGFVLAWIRVGLDTLTDREQAARAQRMRTIHLLTRGGR